MPLEQMMHQMWSTADVHPRDQIGFWVDGLSGAIATVKCEPGRDEPFFGQLRLTEACGFRASTYSSVAQTIKRSHHHVARQPADTTFCLGIQLSGHALGSQSGRDVVLRPGDLVLYDMGRPLELIFRTSFVRTTVVVSRSALVRRVGALEHFIGRRIDGSTGLGAMLSPLLQSLPANMAAVPVSARERVVENLLDLIGTTFLASHDGGRSSSIMSLVAVKFWIETHLDQPLSTDSIASACRISIRHLNRLFEQEKMSPMRFVWERRLARCHRDLSDPAMRGRTVSEIAFAAGFNSLPHFSRAYRAHYGCAPRDSRPSVSVEAVHRR